MDLRNIRGTVCFRALLAPMLAAGAFAELRTDGARLEVQTDRIRAVFSGADLVQLDNVLTGESIASGWESHAPIARLTRANGQRESAGSVWTLNEQDGVPFAQLVSPGPAPSVLFRVWIDPESSQLLIRIGARSSTRGVRGVRWGLRGLDIQEHRLILPLLGGVMHDRAHPPVANYVASSEQVWEAPFLMTASANGGCVVFHEKGQIPYRAIEVAESTGGRYSLAIETTAFGPWSSATSIPEADWRLDCFKGNWTDGADTFRAAASSLAPPPLPPGAEWVRKIRAAINLTGERVDLDKLAQHIDPAQTLLYLPNWRPGYDRNYPDYSPAPGMATYIERARQLGFRVILHVNPYGVSTNHPEYARLRRFQVRDPGTGQLQGWLWERPESEPARFAYINPAAAEWRQTFIRYLKPAIESLKPDAIHLDQTGLAINDGNGLIDGRTAVDGMVELHRELAEQFPGLILGGEGIYDRLAPWQWFAQQWSGEEFGVPGMAHPLRSYLLGARFKPYAYLGTPAAESPGYLSYIRQYERQAVLPTAMIATQQQLDSPSLDLLRVFRVARAFQQNELDPVWEPSAHEDAVVFRGKVSAALRSSGTLRRLEIDGRPIYERVTGVSSVTSALAIAHWPASDGGIWRGLDPLREYWLDPGTASSGPNFARMPGNASLTNETFHTPDGSFLGLQPARFPLLDMLASLGQARTGIAGDRGETALSGNAGVSPASIVCGGVRRAALVVHPPGGTGSTFAEFTLNIPATGKAALLFQTGIADAAPRTAPVAFQVRINGSPVWSRNIGLGRWNPAELDLSPWAGQTISLALLTRADSASFAWAAFAAPVVVHADDSEPVSIRVLAPGKTGAFEVSNIAPNSRLPLFYPPLRPFAANQSLLDLPHHGFYVIEPNMPVPGVVFNSGRIGTVASGGVRKRAIGSHPPSQGSAHLVWVGELPDAAMQLLVSAGLQDGHRSEGVVFRAVINGETVWEHRTSDSGWTQKLIDLARFRASPVMIQLITDSAGSSGFDWASWGDLLFDAGGRAAHNRLPSLAGSARHSKAEASARRPYTSRSGSPETARGGK